MSKRLGGLVAPLMLGAFFISGCGGGGGGGTNPPVTTPTPSPTPTVSPPTTNASGKLVDDPSGAPLSGISVKIEPWIAAATPLPSPQTTTAADGSFTLAGVPSGHYLLVIGSDSTSDTVRPTIHDNVTLAGGNQLLQAPTLPPIPSITPPPMETNGSYRLMTIDATKELPCFNDFNAARVSNSLPKVVVDEWLTENSREVSAYRAGPSFVVGAAWPGNSFGVLTTGHTEDSGGNSCNNSVTPSFTSTDSAYPWASSAQTLWYAGNWYLANSSNAGSGLDTTEFPRDPRAFTDPNVPTWY